MIEERLPVMATLLAILIAGCSPSHIDSLPYWYADVGGTVESTDGSPVSGAIIEWEWYPTDCDNEEPMIAMRFDVADVQGRFGGRVQVDQRGGCFRFLAIAEAQDGSDTASVQLPAHALDLRQEPPYASTTVEMTLP